MNIATLGPSSNTREVIRDLARAGADVFRLNISRSTEADKAGIHAHIRVVLTCPCFQGDS